MKSDFYQSKKPFTIYVLIHPDPEERYFYIGKTSSHRISAIYSRHINGRCVCTRYTFTQEEKPVLHLLETGVTMTPAEAYKHTLAWINLFNQNHYFCLNAASTDIQARLPLPETEQIIAKLSLQSLDEILSNTKVDRPSDADKRILQALPTFTPEPPKQQVVQMNVRMQKEDSLRLRSFCKELHINQREAMTLLIDRAYGDISHCKTLITAYQKKIKKLESDLQKLQKKQQILSGKQLSDSEKRKSQLLSLLHDGCHAYLKRQFPTLTQGKLCKPMQYKKCTQQLPAGISYSYPAGSGHTELRLHRIAWGRAKSHPCFIFGITPDGKHVKFRYYPKKEFFGTPIKDTSYAHAGANWFVLYAAAKDTAAEIIGALPLDVPQVNAPQIVSTSDVDEKDIIPLDDAVADALVRAGV